MNGKRKTIKSGCVPSLFDINNDSPNAAHDQNIELEPIQNELTENDDQLMPQNPLNATAKDNYYNDDDDTRMISSHSISDNSIETSDHINLRNVSDG